MKQHEGVCPCTSVIKEKTPKKKIALNQVRVLARHKLWQFFFRRTVSTTDIVLPCCYEKALQFSGEIWAAKVHACSENLLAHFSVVSRVEVKNLQRSEKAHFLILQLCSKVLLAACAPHWPKNSLKTIPHKQAEGFFHPIFPRYTLIFTRQNSELSHLSTFLWRC